MPNTERPERAHLLLEALSTLGLKTSEPPQIPIHAVRKVHTERLLRFIETAWDEWQKLPGSGPEVVPDIRPHNAVRTYPVSVVGRAGWHMGDAAVPIGARTWEAALGSAAAGYAAAQSIVRGKREAYALCRPPGHHASADVSAGHCLLNNAAIAAEALRENHDRVAILDIDVHHGNGTQDIFYKRADVLTISIHAAPDNFYPFFAGFAHETGEDGGSGYNLNLPLERSTGDQGWLSAISTAIAKLETYKPDALIVALGLDAHENDPLSGLKVTFEGFRQAGRMIAETGLPAALLQEGGYVSPDLTASLASFLSGFLTSRSSAD